MDKMHKRSIVVFAAACVMSSSAMADSMGSKAIQLSNAELDGITAGFAQVVIVNPGNANVFKSNETGSRGVCVNCDGVPPRTGPAFGVVTVENPGKGVFVQVIGKPHFPF